MKILFICKASTDIGLGHLMRSRTLAEAASGHAVSFVVIGSEMVKKLLTGVPFHVDIISSEDDLPKYISGNYDAVVFDMMDIEENWFSFLREKAFLCVSISPVFNRMENIDILFSRTRYSSKSYDLSNVRAYLGLEYAIIQKACTHINSHLFNNNLSRENLPVAISMGGGDAANKTLMFLHSLKKCNVSATFWVLVGEGYAHSYDALIKTIDRDKNHEIILVKTNVSMWQILNNCVLAILPGGVTTYEAAYAGLPTINMFDTKDQFFLIKELEEAGVCLNAGLINEHNLVELNKLIEKLDKDRKRLLEMHDKSKKLIDGKGSERIIGIIEKEMKALS